MWLQEKKEKNLVLDDWGEKFEGKKECRKIVASNLTGAQWKIEFQTRLIAENWLDWTTITMENHPKIARTVNCAGGIPLCFIAVMPVQCILSIGLG